MDYHSLKRKELQSLCKEHNIPANSANSVLADKLSALLNKPVTRHRTCIKSSVEATEEGEDAVLKRQAKKVRFSPNNDLVEYELRSGEKQKDMVTQIKARRNSVVKKVDKLAVDNNAAVELVADNVQMPVKITRSRVQSSGKDAVVLNNEKKPSRREAKVVEKGTVVDKETENYVGKVTRSKAHVLKLGGGVQHEESRQSKRLCKDVEKVSESDEGTVVSRARVTRSKAPELMEGGTVSDVNPQVKKKRGKQLEADEKYVEPSKEMMDIPVRATRSKAQALMEGGTDSDVNPHVKKRRGKQVETDGKDVKPFEEVMDNPVRATRSRRQTLKEDTGNMVANPQADKKRTRREMKATDLRSDTSHVASVDKQEPSKRKSLRTRETETVNEYKYDKVEVVGGGRVTRSKAFLAPKSSGRNSKNKANKVESEQLGEPSKHAGKKNVNRRKSVLQPEKAEVVLNLKEPVNRPARKNTRRKSVVQIAPEMVESPTVGIKQSKGQFGKLSMIEGLGGKENVIRSGKDASENEFKEASSGVPKSRKRRGTPIDEDHIIETEYGSVDKSPKRSTRSASKSEGKSVAKEQVESSLKKPLLRINNQSSVENASKGKSGALRSGAIMRESSSKKRAKLSRVKPSASEDHEVKSSKEGTPVAKLGTSNVDEDLTEVTPALDKSDKRFKRSIIRSERKEPSQPSFKEQRITRSTIKSEIQEPGQSAIREQPIADTQMLSPKPAKFRHDLIVNTAPGRITRRGVKHGVNAAGSLSEKVGKKKHASQSSHKKQPLDNDQMASPKVAEVMPNPDLATIGVQSEFENPLDEVHTSSPEVAEVGPDTAIQTVEVQSEIKHHDDVQMFSPEVAEVRPNPDCDNVVVETEFSKVKGYILGDLSASESARLPGKVVEENTISERGTFIEVESVGLVPEEKASGEVMQDAGACIEKSTSENIADSQLFSPKFANFRPDQVVNTAPGRITRRGIKHGGSAAGSFSEKVGKKKATQLAHKKQSHDDDQMASPKVAEVRPNSDVATIGVQSEFKQSLSEVQMSPPEVGPNTGIETIELQSEIKQHHDVQMCSPEAAEVRPNLDSDIVGIDTEFSKIKGQIMVGLSASESVGLPSKVVENTISESGTPIAMESASVGTSVLKFGRPDAKEKEMELTESGSNSKGLQIDAIEEQEASVAKVVVVDESVVATAGNSGDADNKCDPICFDVGASAVCQSPFEQPQVDSKHMPSAKGGKIGGSGSVQILFVDNHDVDDDEQYNEDEGASAQKPLMSEPDSENKSVADGFDVQENPFSGNDIFGDSDNDISDRKSGLDMFDAPLPGKGDVLGEDLNVPIGPQTGLDLSNAIETLEVSVSGNDIDIKCDVEDHSDVQDGNSEHDQITSNDNPARDGCSPVVCEAVVQPHGQEPGQVLNVAVDDAPCDTVGLSASVTSKDAPKNPATGGLDDMDVRVDTLQESVLDMNKDVISSILGDIYDTDADNDDEQQLTEVDEAVQPMGGGNISSDMSNEQTKEEDEMSRGNDNTLDDQEHTTIDILDSNSGKIIEGGSHFSAHKGDSELVRNIIANEDPTREASPTVYTKGESTVGGKDSSQLMEGRPVDDTGSDLPTFKEDDSNEQEETLNAGTSVDWGGYDFNIDDLEEPVTASRSAVAVGKGNKDDQDSGLHTTARTIISIEESSGLAANNLEKDSRKADDGKSMQGVDLLNERANADMSEDGFNWPDSSLKSLFTEADTAKVSHVTKSQAETVSFTFQYDGGNDDMGTSRTSALKFNHQWVNDDPSKVSHAETETQNNPMRGPGNEMYGVSSFEDYPLKLFGDDEAVGGSVDSSERSTHFEFKGDQGDQIKQFDFLSEPSGTSHHDISGLKENNFIPSHEFEKKKETVTKGLETGDDLAVDRGE